MKYKILFVASRPTGGVQYHRMHVPHNALARLCPEFDVSTIDTLSGVSDDFLRDFHLVCFSRTASYLYRKRVSPVNDGANPWDVWYFEAQEIMERMRKLGIVIVVDLDDTWKLHKKHLYYWNYVKEHIGEHNELCCRMADQVICTTEGFRVELINYSPNVEVLPNAIDTTLDQFKPRPTQFPLMRFGWMGSSSHTDDIIPLHGPLRKLFNDRPIAKKMQLVLGGFKLTDKVNKYDPNTGRVQAINLHASQMVHARFERIFTDEYNNIREFPGYVNYLKQYDNTTPEIMETMPYKRIWYRAVDQYATAYNELDVSLAPLQDHFFNNCKSQLKLIEAGFMGKALICSNVYPYTIDGEHERNCLMVDRPEQWHYMMRRLVMNPEMGKDLAGELAASVKMKYNIEPITRLRADLYRSLIDNKNKV